VQASKAIADSLKYGWCGSCEGGRRFAGPICLSRHTACFATVGLTACATKSNGTRSITAHPCKERKDGAPSLGIGRQRSPKAATRQSTGRPMAETFEAYRTRVLRYLGDEEPIAVQQATSSQLDRRLRDVVPEQLIRRPAPENMRQKIRELNVR
jgi:hypothetical protein